MVIYVFFNSSVNSLLTHKFGRILKKLMNKLETKKNNDNLGLLIVKIK